MNVDQNSNTKCNDENRHRADAYILRPSSYKNKVIHWTEWRWLVHEKAQQESLFTIYRYFSNFLYKRSTPRSFCNTNCENTCYPSLYRTLDSPLIILINGINSLTECSDRKVRYSYCNWRSSFWVKISQVCVGNVFLQFDVCSYHRSSNIP